MIVVVVLKEWQVNIVGCPGTHVLSGARKTRLIDKGRMKEVIYYQVPGVHFDAC